MVGNQKKRYANICNICLNALTRHEELSHEEGLSHEEFMQVHAFNPRTGANFILDVVHEDASSDYAILKSGTATSLAACNPLHNIV